MSRNDKLFVVAMHQITMAGIAGLTLLIVDNIILDIAFSVTVIILLFSTMGKYAKIAEDDPDYLRSDK